MRIKYKFFTKFRTLSKFLFIETLLLWLFFILLSVGAGYVLTHPAETEHYFPMPGWFWLCSIAVMSVSSLYFVFLCISSLFASGWHDVYDDETLPDCAVVVPAYNEGRHVYDTLENLLQCDYPAEKLEIFAINDGSVDDTLRWLREAEKLAPERIRVIDLKRNQGKKHALFTGIMCSKAPFIVTIDSDTLPEKNAIRKLMQPFADPETGGVAGTITANRNTTNFHCKMLDVMLVFGCEFLRRAQAAAGIVFCTPGALSAYRKSAILPLLDTWLNQSFLGAPAAIGEDRAIATLLLSAGYRVVHQQEAEAETSLPECYTRVCKMLLRWTRSDVRENILMTPTVLRLMKRCDLRGIVLFLNWLALNINMLLPFIFLPMTLYLFVSSGDIAFSCALLLGSSLVWSVIPGLIYCRKKRSIFQLVWAFGFGFYTLFLLSWISIYAVFTVRNSKWLTRERKKQTLCS